MKIFIDSAEVEVIRSAFETGLIDGVTTNPTLIRVGLVVTPSIRPVSNAERITSTSAESIKIFIKK